VVNDSNHPQNILAPEYHGSKATMSLEYEITKSPPYCGLPRLSHQFPVTAVVVAVVVVGVVVVVVVVVVVLVVDVGVEVDDVVLLHDAKTSDATTRQVSSIQVIPFFIQTSINFRILTENLPWPYSQVFLECVNHYS